MRNRTRRRRQRLAEAIVTVTAHDPPDTPLPEHLAATVAALLAHTGRLR